MRATQVSEQAAAGQVGGLRDRIAHLEASLAGAEERAVALQRSLDAQVGTGWGGGGGLARGGRRLCVAVM